MSLEKIKKIAEEKSRQYNPEGLSPYPFQNVPKDLDDLEIMLTDELPDHISGIIFLDDEELDDVKVVKFAILINSVKPLTRQNFTIAHELGHYFLHQDEIKKKLIVDNDSVFEADRMLFRNDDAESTRLEIEANSFAASFLMPSDLVKKAWEELRSVEECSQLFNVSVQAMSIRLSRLGLVE
ncbi:MAG: ImmA/IrrE family metallo-endopeptidase [bacterium]